ncbi:hypothetical protein WN943_016887 [Citrus x changshan-huyou]
MLPFNYCLASCKLQFKGGITFLPLPFEVPGLYFNALPLRNSYLEEYAILYPKVSFISPFLRRTIAGKIKALPWINGGFSDRSLFGLSKRKRHVLLSSRVLVTLTEVGNPKQKRLYLAHTPEFLCRFGSLISLEEREVDTVDDLVE